VQLVKHKRRQEEEEEEETSIQITICDQSDAW
jgi:hypothetical protein